MKDHLAATCRVAKELCPDPVTLAFAFKCADHTHSSHPNLLGCQSNIMDPLILAIKGLQWPSSPWALMVNSWVLRNLHK